MMAAYYNENDPYAAQWLRNLIEGGLIAPGDVDDRSIESVEPADLAGYAQCHFFAGIGGWSYALRLAGWPDTEQVWTGSCPCQPFSSAGKGEGTADKRHLWPKWYRLIIERMPAKLLGEQVANAIAHGWINEVAHDLEAIDYAFGAAVIPACGVDAPHIRSRVWFVADSALQRLKGERIQLREKPIKDFKTNRSCEAGDSASGFWSNAVWIECRDGKRRPVEPGTFPVVDGVPGRVGRLRAYGNAIVPQVAAEVIRAFMECSP